MEHWEASQQGAHCNIIVTQPRRLSAISLAEWVAHERQERVSDKVAYGFERNKFQFKGYRIVTRQVDLAVMLWICVREDPNSNFSWVILYFCIMLWHLYHRLLCVEANFLHINLISDCMSD
jgi:hypothetical protein